MKMKKLFFLMLATACLDSIASDKAKSDAEPTKTVAPARPATAAVSTAAETGGGDMSISVAGSPFPDTASPALSPLSDAGSHTSMNPMGLSRSSMGASGVRTPLTTPPPSLASSFAGDDKQTAEDLEYAHVKAELFQLGRRNPQLLVGAAAESSIALDEANKNTSAMRLMWRLSTRILFTEYPKTANPKPRVTSLERLWPNASSAAARYFNDTYHNSFFERLGEIAQEEGSFDISQLQLETILHYNPGYLDNPAQIGQSARSQTPARRNSFSEDSKPKTKALRLKTTTTQYDAKLDAQFTAAVEAKVAKEVTPEVTKRLKSQLEPKVRQELRKELKAQVTADERFENHLRYAACVGAGCALGMAALWTYNALTGTPKAAQK